MAKLNGKRSEKFDIVDKSGFNLQKSDLDNKGCFKLAGAVILNCF